MKFKKIIAVTLLLIIGVMIFTKSVNAVTSFDVDVAYIFIKGRAKPCLGLTSGGYVGVTKVAYLHDGKSYPAYCLDPELDGVGEVAGYSVTVEGLVNNPLVWRVITQGYPYKSVRELGLIDEDEAFTATKQAVYCVINNYDLSRYCPYADAGDSGIRTYNAMKKMVEYARNSSNVKPSSNIKLKEITDWEIDDTNKYVTKLYEINTEAPAHNYKINLENDFDGNLKIIDKAGNNFRVQVPVTFLKNDGDFKILVEAEVDTYPILFGKSGDSNYQDYALTGAIYEIGKGNITSKYYKNTSKLKIIKIENINENKLEGVEFNIKDESGNIIYSNLKTNQDGEIIIDGILPGKYYLEETQNLNGYEKLIGDIEFEMKLNEELELVVKNERERPEIKRNISYSEKLEKLPVTGK